MGGWGRGAPLVVNTNDLMGSIPINKAGIHEDVFLRVSIGKKKCNGSGFREHARGTVMKWTEHDTLL